MANTNNTIEKWQHLIDYGQNKNKMQVNTKPLIERAIKANDGSTYAILRENGKYCLMVAPPKNSELVAEDFRPLDGENNRKFNEYSSYNMATEYLERKVKNINEQIYYNNPDLKPSQPTIKEAKSFQNSITKEMREQLNRYNEIFDNMNLIENKYVPSAHTLPEAPAKNPSEQQVNTPFTDTAVAKGDKEFNETETNYAKAGEPYNKDGKATNADMESVNKPSASNNGQDTYSKPADYTPEGSVANQHPTGGKVTRADESVTINGRNIRITSAQQRFLAENKDLIQAWNNSDKNSLDTSSDTQIGSSEPYNKEVGKQSNQTDAPVEHIHENEGTVVHNTFDQNKPTPGTSEPGDNAPYDKKVNENGIDPANVVGMPDNVGEEDFDVEYEKWANDYSNNEPFFNADTLNQPTEPIVDVQDQISEPASQEGPFGESKNRKPCRESKKVSGKRIISESNENRDWHGVPGARFISHGEWSDPEIEYNGKFINYWDFADFFNSDEEEQNATPEEVKSILDEIILGMSEGGEMGESCKHKVNEGNVDLKFGEHPAYQKTSFTTLPNKEVAINGAHEIDDKSAQTDKPFGTEKGDIQPYDKVIDAMTEAFLGHLNFQNKA